MKIGTFNHMEPQKYKYDDLWAEESEARIKAFDSGKLKALDGQTVVKEIKRDYDIQGGTL